MDSSGFYVTSLFKAWPFSGICFVSRRCRPLKGRNQQNWDPKHENRRPQSNTETQRLELRARKSSASVPATATEEAAVYSEMLSNISFCASLPRRVRIFWGVLPVLLWELFLGIKTGRKKTPKKKRPPKKNNKKSPEKPGKTPQRTPQAPKQGVHVH